MERPSHTIVPTSHRHRLPLLALAASVQIGVIWLFLHGLATGRIPFVPGPLTVADIREAAPPKGDPPPPPRLVDKIAVPTPIIDDFTVEPGTSIRSTKSETTTSTVPTIVPPAVPDHPAVSITATHTTPPYPVVARRTGAEGKVTLQLTVAPTGRVSAAQVIASSGSDALDLAARQWILAHWVYRPALDHGQPVAGQALATVTFNLKDAR